MTTELTKAAQQALEQLEFLNACYPHKTAADAIASLQSALTQRPAAQTDRDADTGPRVLREVFALCEDTIDKMAAEGTEFSRGRAFEAKGISRAIGTWFQDEYCGKSYMGEPSLPATQQATPEPDRDGEAFRTAARLGLTLRFYGGCAQSGMPGSPSAYQVVTAGDPAAAMREAVERAAAVIQAGGEAQKIATPEPVGAREALARIASWNEHPAMLGVDYGSNGVRDYYRKIARDSLNRHAPGVPEVLFDGFAVLKALTPQAERRTSAENVSDVLDAVVRLIRAAAQAKGGDHG